MSGWREALLTAEEMRAAEARYAGSTLELMERAGVACAEVARRDFEAAETWVVHCGTGANGGDGLVVARLLHEGGKRVKVILHGAQERLGGDAAANFERLRSLPVPVHGKGAAAAAPDAIVDALFGTGFHGEPRTEGARAIDAINEAGCPVLAVDLPSGVDASTGAVAGSAVRADSTVTFHRRKLGHAIAPGRFYAGAVTVADIGLSPGAESANAAVTTEILAQVPRRAEQDHKYSAGALLVVGGSQGLTGAPSLSAESALRAGAGIVWACVPASLNVVFEQRLLEVMTIPCPDDDRGRLRAGAAEPVIAAAERAGAVALGPGLGRSEETRALVLHLLERLPVPVVVDADGLWALAGGLETLKGRTAPTVLTPHTGELARLLGWNPEAVDGRRHAAAMEAAEAAGAVVLLKGPDTIVATPGLPGVLVSEHGSPALATAGTGDALCGTIGAFLAKGLDGTTAAAAGAVAGGVAGRIAAERHGQDGVLARDVVEAVALAVSRPPR